MSNRLSHSSLTSWQDCPMKYKYRYVNKYYPITTSAPLIFGSALDKSVENLLETRDLQSARNTFFRMWDEQEINKVPTSLAKSIKVVYANSDFDIELLNSDDKDLLSSYAKESGLIGSEDIEDLMTRIYKQKEIVGFDMLPDERKRVLNYANWLCLRVKGILMLDTFNVNILPNIEEVLGTQIEINMENEDGDKIIGYADMVVRWKGISEPIIFDLKTATREYDDNAVLVSPQLTLYTHALSGVYNTRRAGFLVLHKTIKKNKKKTCSVCGHDGTGGSHKTCSNEILEEGAKKPKRCNAPWIIEMDPKASYQILINEIPERMEELVIENMEAINLCIKQGIFTRNLGSCSQRYGLCGYYSLCHKCDFTGLVDMSVVV
jgi:hypothetical protein